MRLGNPPVKVSVLASLLVLTVSFQVGVAAAVGLPSSGHVYTMTNDPAGNAVVVFNRAADGTLTKSGSFPTGGTSIGFFATGNQNGLLLSQSGQCLWAVNSMSDSITAFHVRGDSLKLVNTVASGGRRPISLTEHNGLLYALNAGGQLRDANVDATASDNISGFTVGFGCGLSPLSGSTQPLSDVSTSPAEVSFTPSGRVLVVTEKVTNMITTYTVDKNGRPSGPNPQPSAGGEPFGFTFINRGQMLVTEADCHAPQPPGNLPGCSVPPDAPALSSYDVADDGTLTLIDNEVDDQAAKCWVVATNSQRFAFTVNALATQTGGTPGLPPAGSITSYHLDPDGSLTELGVTPIPLAPVGVPVDAALSLNSRFLYVLSEGDGTISGFQVGSDGGLTLLGTFAITAVPAIATNGPFPNGLAAR